MVVCDDISGEWSKQTCNQNPVITKFTGPRPTVPQARLNVLLSNNLVDNVGSINVMPTK